MINQVPTVPQHECCRCIYEEGYHTIECSNEKSQLPPQEVALINVCVVNSGHFEFVREGANGRYVTD